MDRQGWPAVVALLWAIRSGVEHRWRQMQAPLVRIRDDSDQP